VAGVLAKLQIDPAELGITQVATRSERSGTWVTDAAHESAENPPPPNDAVSMISSMPEQESALPPLQTAP